MIARDKVTDEMVERAYQAYYMRVTAGGRSVRDAMRRALEAAMNLPPVVCKNCGTPKSIHTAYAQDLSPRCPGYVWEPAS